MYIQKTFTLPTQKDIDKCNKKGHKWNLIECLSKKYHIDLFECSRCKKQETN